MVLIFWLFQIANLVASASADTKASLQEIVSELSGAKPATIGSGYIGFSQRYSDSGEVFFAADYLVQHYKELGGFEVSEPLYDPLDLLPEHSAYTSEVYRRYLSKRSAAMGEEFADYCAGRLRDDSARKVEARLGRVKLERKRLCETDPSARVDLYISAAIEVSVESTRAELEKKTYARWPNVVAILRTSDQGGSSQERSLCVLGAHFDSIVREAGGRGKTLSPDVAAPGADDNASGTAAVLLLARHLKSWAAKLGHPLPCDLAFTHFSGEEEGLFGSLAFAKEHQRRVRWMINFDMIAYNPPGSVARMNLGYEQSAGQNLMERFRRGASGTLPLVAVDKTHFIYSSDQISFWMKGIPALDVSEQACSDEACAKPYEFFNPSLHTPNDTVSGLDFDYAAQIVEQSLAGIENVLLTDK